MFNYVIGNNTNYIRIKKGKAKMRYSYNIKVNFNSKLYNFYEWGINDSINILEKVLTYKIDDYLFSLIISGKILFDHSFVSILRNTNNENAIPIIFCTNYDSICIKVNKNG